MWKDALLLGKLSLAKNYAKKLFEYLFKYKRTPEIRQFLISIKELGLDKEQIEEYLIAEEILLGKRKKITHLEMKFIHTLMDHPEHWKESSLFLKQYLLLNEDWSYDDWKLCYQYILINHFDQDIFMALFKKTEVGNNQLFNKKLRELFKIKKIKLPPEKKKVKKSPGKILEELNFDYDQVAIDLLSGEKEPSYEEQRRVINSLKFMTNQELKLKGKEMMVAFELLGMEQVVMVLCEKMVKILIDTKERISAYFIWAQALSQQGEDYQALELVDHVFSHEPLYGEERLTFMYLKAESYLKLKKIKQAKELYLEIIKLNPRYRLAGERLKSIETIK